MYKLFAEAKNWAYFRNGSRGGSKYLVIDSVMSFYDAQQRCKVLGGGVAGHLAHINTIQEQLFIESYLSKLMARHSNYNHYHKMCFFFKFIYSLYYLGRHLWIDYFF